ncbi:hypothetical protein [Nitratireductor sp. OM-1]|uniref:hypothetical protein n=1 Tax=Nitratireductor sp. OM-1 TaxID=1756988 RepID=UPI0013AF0940|nr:hypothetical protein [Nitratireductor sp. OM-1]
MSRKIQPLVCAHCGSLSPRAASRCLHCLSPIRQDDQPVKLPARPRERPGRGFRRVDLEVSLI